MWGLSLLRSKLLVFVPLLLLLGGIMIACGDDATPTAPATSTSPSPTNTSPAPTATSPAPLGHLAGSHGDHRSGSADAYIAGAHRHLTAGHPYIAGAHGHSCTRVFPEGPRGQPQARWHPQVDCHSQTCPLRPRAGD